MTQTPIRATDEIVLPFPPSDVWCVLEDIDEYPKWWPRSVGLRVLHREPQLVGSSLQLRPLGGRSFSCRVESIDPPNRLAMRYFGGFIDGIGEWRLEPIGSSTRVQYELNVNATGLFVALIGRMLPLSRIHSFQMKQVLRNLEKAVGKKIKG